MNVYNNIRIKKSFILIRLQCCSVAWLFVMFSTHENSHIHWFASVKTSFFVLEKKSLWDIIFVQLSLSFSRGEGFQ